ncbi:Secretoglobin Family 1C Member 2 [Manis pentadactyla]|nr:Secretoglobin Family 1C Member 2 [Manis pentadactyla]
MTRFSRASQWTKENSRVLSVGSLLTVSFLVILEAMWKITFGNVLVTKASKISYRKWRSCRDGREPSHQKPT